MNNIVPVFVMKAWPPEVGDTPHELSFLTVLQHLLKIDPGNERLSETVWQAVEQLVSKATVIESREDAQKLLTSVTRRIDGSSSGCIVASPSRPRRGSQVDLLQESSSQADNGLVVTPASANSNESSVSSMTVLSPSTRWPSSSTTTTRRPSVLQCDSCRRSAANQYPKTPRQDEDFTVAENPYHQRDRES
ncbi:LOW QUALITY PROTEIN: FH2 domain-containing protein 1 [Elysia marginata]|uniref:FH2 domain-containing protein 1 n=1 Tax=Elysia marginata TaxID=1093978 RepID=A0AAV4IJN7_9GAST|nr:LOW QUALITY PROTEIN: FH2 domain-containing protein 1 [Elysia marginata]